MQTGILRDIAQSTGTSTVSVRRSSLPELFALSMDTVRASIATGRTVIVIYDSLQRLKQDEPSIRRTLATKAESRTRRFWQSTPSTTRNANRVNRDAAEDTTIPATTMSSCVPRPWRSASRFGARSCSRNPGTDLPASCSASAGCHVEPMTDRSSCRCLSGAAIAVPGREGSPQSFTIMTRLDVEAFIREVLRDVRRRLEPPRREAEADSVADGANDTVLSGAPHGEGCSGPLCSSWPSGERR